MSREQMDVIIEMIRIRCASVTDSIEFFQRTTFLFSKIFSDDLSLKVSISQDKLLKIFTVELINSIVILSDILYRNLDNLDMILNFVGKCKSVYLLPLIECILRFENYIHQDMMKSLKNLELYTLEYLIWKDENFYTLLQLKNNSLNSISIIYSRMTEKNLDENHPSISPLDFIVRKIIRFTAKCIACFENVLKLSIHTVVAMWNFFLFIFENEHELKILNDKHLLQVLALILYSISKLNDEPRSFSQILKCLKNLDLSFINDNNLKSIFDINGNSINILTYYNYRFLPRFKETIYNVTRINHYQIEWEYSKLFGLISHKSSNIMLSPNVSLSCSPMKTFLTDNQRKQTIRRKLDFHTEL